MNKFENLLNYSSKEIRGARAKILGEDVKDAATRLVQEFNDKKRDIERKLLELTDLHRESELSLRIIKKDFNAKVWIKEIHALEIQLALAVEELETAKKIEKEWVLDEVKEDKIIKKDSDE